MNLGYIRPTFYFLQKWLPNLKQGVIITIFRDWLLSPLIIQIMPPWVMIAECIVDVDRRPKQDVSNGKKNAGKIATTSSTRHPTTFWGRQPKEVPETDS